MRVAERALSPAELYAADEVFLTSTGKGVVSVVSLSGRAVGSGAVGPVATRVAALYHTATTTPDQARPEWLTPVSPGTGGARAPGPPPAALGLLTGTPRRATPLTTTTPTMRICG